MIYYYFYKRGLGLTQVLWQSISFARRGRKTNLNGTLWAKYHPQSGRMSLKWSGAPVEQETAQNVMWLGLLRTTSSPSEGNEFWIKSRVWRLQEQSMCAQCSLGVLFTTAKLPVIFCSNQIKVPHADTNFSQGYMKSNYQENPDSSMFSTQSCLSFQVLKLVVAQLQCV